MAIRIISPPAAFLKFGATPEDHCIFGLIDFPLPIVYSTDYAWQWILTGDTEGETNSIYDATVEVGIVNDCDDANFLLVFPNQATRSKLSPTQILYNWGFGMPNFTSVISVGECFRVRVRVNGTDVGCSNPLKRISVNDEVCFTTVIDYANDGEAGFGFFGCGPAADPGSGGPVDGDGNCIPEIIEFANVPTLAIPLTADLTDRFGIIPSVQVWLTDTNGNLYNAGISAVFTGGNPPTGIFIDFGGNASGAVRIGN